MSAREEQPDTVPPPAGEDDAYSAATKVGMMPAELMARLRAEGLLPDEPAKESNNTEPTPVVSAATASAPTKPPPPLVSHQGDESDEMTQLYVELSSQEVLPAEEAMAPPAPPARAPAAAVGVVETPTAFAAPSTPLVAPSESAPSSTDDAREIAAFGGRSKKRMLVVILIGIIALVAFAFVMALMSQHR
jgi:hypothetical protein